MFKNFLKKLVLPVTLAGTIMFVGNTSHALGTKELNRGMNDKSVQVLQDELKKVGLFNIEDTTEYFGYYTELAIKQLQKLQGLEETGKYDEATHEALKAVKAAKKEELIKEGKLVGYKRTLFLNTKGKDVTVVQEKLKELGYLNIENCTDFYGRKTADAVKLLQDTYGLTADGATGPATVDLINDILLGNVELIEPVVEEVADHVDTLLSTANSLKGTRYSYGASGPNAFDCSGFTQHVFKKSGINIPRTSRGQAGAGTRVGRSNLEPGDLVLFAGTAGRGGISHVGIYTGGGKFIHCSTSRGVVTDSLSSGYYNSRFSHGQRVK